MIGIKIRGSFLDLFPSTTLSIELNNTIFLGDNYDAIPGSFAFPIDIPLTDKNNSILDSPGR
ncbi:MAG: hypothetical protein ABI002_00385, partial [Saprospiraceae bacterium]